MSAAGSAPGAGAKAVARAVQRRARAQTGGPGAQAPSHGVQADGVPPEDAMYARLVAAILEHRLAPGAKLVEDRLARAFGVSRTRVRPVLVRLANEQLVTLTPNRGAAIARPGPQQALEVFEARRLIEPRLVELCIAHAAPADIAALRACIAQEQAARAKGERCGAIRLSGEFHLRIAQAAGQQTLARMLRELVSRSSLILMAWGPGPAAHSAADAAAACDCREHGALIDAIVQRDARSAARLMRKHLEHIAAQLDFNPPQPTPAQDLAGVLGSSNG